MSILIDIKPFNIVIAGGSNNALFADAGDSHLNGAALVTGSNQAALQLDFGDTTGDTLTASFSLSGNAILLAKNASTSGGTVVPTGLNRNASGTQTINSNLTLGQTQQWNVQGSGSLVVNGVVGDGGSGYALTKSGGGTLELATGNTFAGAFTLQGGTVFADTAASLGTDTTDAVLLNTAASVSNATLLLGNGVTLTRNLVAQANTAGKSVTVGGVAGGTATFAGDLALHQGVQVDAAASTTVTVSGAIADGATAGTVDKIDPGTAVLSGTNLYTGTTTVRAGTLLVNGRNTGGGAYGVASGATLGGSGSVVTGGGTAGLRVANGATLSPGTATATGTFGVTGEVILDGTLALRVSDPAGDTLNDTGTLTIAPDATLVLTATPLTHAAYVLARYTTLAGTWTAVSGLPDGYALDYDYGNANDITLVRGAVPEPAATGLLLASGLLMRRRAVRR